MNTIINTSSVTDYSGEPPIVTYSNPVTTVIRQTPAPVVITRFVHCSCCNCDCNCGCCRCGCCQCNCCNCGCNLNI